MQILIGVKFLDPACGGNGNFLTETYLSIRRLENKIINVLYSGQITIVDTRAFNPIKVSISRFYGIEINDFAITVSNTALWIAESQMMKETQDIIITELLISKLFDVCIFKLIRATAKVILPCIQIN